MNTFLPNRNGFGEINPKMNNISLQTASSHFFNLSPILKPCTIKEKYLTILFNVEQVMVSDMQSLDASFFI